jgi:hypothetical protein
MNAETKQDEKYQKQRKRINILIARRMKTSSKKTCLIASAHEHNKLKGIGQTPSLEWRTVKTSF